MIKRSISILIALLFIAITMQAANKEAFATGTCVTSGTLDTTGLFTLNFQFGTNEYTGVNQLPQFSPVSMEILNTDGSLAYNLGNIGIGSGGADCTDTGGGNAICTRTYTINTTGFTYPPYTYRATGTGSSPFTCQAEITSAAPPIPPPAPSPSGGSGAGGGSGSGTSTPTDFDDFNPLLIEGSPYAAEFQTPAGILNRLLGSFLFPIAGMILFIMLIWGGFETLLGATGSKKDAGKQRATTAVIGFLLLFASYWIAQLIQAIFGVRFLG